MNANTASVPDGTNCPNPPAAPAAAPTGYRVSISTTALEISARLATPDELNNLVKILQANAAIWGNVTKTEVA